MGHTRKADSAPSPVQLLAIFQAKEMGVSLDEIHRRTKYSVSSIKRWWNKWGKDTAFFEAVACENPELVAEHSFDALWPDTKNQSAFELLESCRKSSDESDHTQAMHDFCAQMGEQLKKDDVGYMMSPTAQLTAEFVKQLSQSSDRVSTLGAKSFLNFHIPGDEQNEFDPFQKLQAGAPKRGFTPVVISNVDGPQSPSDDEDWDQ